VIFEAWSAKIRFFFCWFSAFLLCLRYNGYIKKTGAGKQADTMQKYLIMKYDGYCISDDSFVICSTVTTATKLFEKMLKEPWDAMVKCLEENGDTFRKVDGEWTDDDGRSFNECVDAFEFDDGAGCSLDVYLVDEIAEN